MLHAALPPRQCCGRPFRLHSAHAALLLISQPTAMSKAQPCDPCQPSSMPAVPQPQLNPCWLSPRTLPMVGFSLEPSVSSRPPEVLSAASTTSISTRSCGRASAREQSLAREHGGTAFRAAVPQQPAPAHACQPCRSAVPVLSQLHARKLITLQLPHQQQQHMLFTSACAAHLQRLQLGNVIAAGQQANHIVLLHPATASRASQVSERRHGTRCDEVPSTATCRPRAWPPQGTWWCSARGCGALLCTCGCPARCGAFHTAQHSRLSSAADPPTGCSSATPRSGSFQRRRTLSST